LTGPVVILGGGPAGAVAGLLLAEWGHHAIILEQHAGRSSNDERRPSRPDESQGLAESVPPSARKLFHQIGILDEIESARFYRTRGNTAWWGGDDARIESFEGGRLGWQIFRPEFDAWLLDLARQRGVDVWTSARVRGVEPSSGDSAAAVVAVDRNGVRQTLSCNWILDCSGRAGVLARGTRRPGVRAFSLVGLWRTSDGWNVPDGTHTLVEAFDRGWSWSIPIDDDWRQIGIMLDGPSPRREGSRALVEAYRAELDRTSHMTRHVGHAELQSVWACDASTYTSAGCAGPRHLLVGDAASFIDPLSSFGVKKAMGSAWMAAVVVNTILRDVDNRERRDAAIELFESWERDITAAHTAQTREFARAAAAHYGGRFWSDRANLPIAASNDPADGGASEAAALRAALLDIRDSAEIGFDLDAHVRYEARPVIRDHEVVLEDSFPSGVRFRDNVDLVALARLACEHRHVPDLFDAYCRSTAPVPLPSVLGGLSLLVAKGYLVKKDVIRC
jgi:flavin-dependent dehydrogenase